MKRGTHENIQKDEPSWQSSSHQRCTCLHEKVTYGVELDRFNVDKISLLTVPILSSRKWSIKNSLSTVLHRNWKIFFISHRQLIKDISHWKWLCTETSACRGALIWTPYGMKHFYELTCSKEAQKISEQVLSLSIFTGYRVHCDAQMMMLGVPWESNNVSLFTKRTFVLCDTLQFYYENASNYLVAVIKSFMTKVLSQQEKISSQFRLLLTWKLCWFYQVCLLFLKDFMKLMLTENYLNQI